VTGVRGYANDCLSESEIDSCNRTALSSGLQLIVGQLFWTAELDVLRMGVSALADGGAAGRSTSGQLDEEDDRRVCYAHFGVETDVR